MQSLATSRRAGLPFDTAWARAVIAAEPFIEQLPKVAGRDWRVALRATRWAYEAAYTGEPAPNGIAALVVLVAELPALAGQWQAPSYDLAA